MMIYLIILLHKFNHFIYIVTCRGLCVTYKTGSGLDDWVYCTLYIHTTRDYRQYSAIFDLQTLQFTVPQALGFSVFTSRILETDLSQSHCNFKSHMKLHSLIPFLPLLSTQFNSSAPKLIARQADISKLDSSFSTPTFYTTEHFYITTLHGPHGKYSLYF
jgi:hypothetical protein